MMTKFKVGEKYKTRDGDDAVVYAIHEGQDFCLHGAIKDGPTWKVASWRGCGYFYGDGAHHNDLILPKPKPREWCVWVKSNGVMRDSSFFDKDPSTNFPDWKLVKVREVLEDD